MREKEGMREMEREREIIYVLLHMCYNEINTLL